jgi:hypothetical protein
MMTENLYKYLMQGCGVGEPGRSCKKPSNNINICSISETGIPILGICDDSKHGRRTIQCGSMKNID